MRLLIASVDVLPQIGGVSLATHHLANALVREGCSVTVLGPPGASIPETYQAEYQLYKDEVADLSVLEGPIWRDDIFPALVTRVEALWRRGHYDRSLAMHPTYFGPALGEVARQMGKLNSVMFHGLELRSQMLSSARRRALWMRFCGRGPNFSDIVYKLAASADDILVNSHYTGGLAKKVAPHADIKIIGCGLEQQRARAEIELASDVMDARRREIRAELCIDQSVFLVGATGRLVRSKNMTDLVSVLQKLPDAHALILGDGPERQALIELGKKLGVSQRLHIVGAVTEEEKWSYLRAMDVFCMLSKPGRHGEVEGFGIALLEASAAGLPVIAAKAGGMVDVVAHGKTGFLIKPGSVSELAKILRNVRATPEASEILVEAARQNIMTKFNWSAIAQDLLKRWTG